MTIDRTNHNESAGSSQVLDVVREYRRLGWWVTPIRRGTKRPMIDAWQTLGMGEEALVLAFAVEDPPNIGIVLGRPCGGLVDIDLDCDEAVRLAPKFLPQTSAVFGRAGKPRSHWLYRVQEPPKYLQLKDPVTKKGMIELRADGHQTVFPPSIHESGEVVEWADGARDEQGCLLPPAEVDADTLLKAVQKLGAATLLSRHWPDDGAGTRHFCALHLSGGLMRAGWTEEQVQDFLVPILEVGDDDEEEDRLRAVADTARKMDEGHEQITGWPSLAEIINPDTVAKLRDWLGIKSESGQCPLSDVGNAQRLVLRHGQDLRYVAEWKSWMIWDGRRWVRDRGEVTRRAIDTVMSIVDDARNEADPDRRTALLKWAAQSQNEKRIKALIELAKSDRTVDASPDEFDADPWLLNCSNGTLNLRTGGLLPHDRSDLSTKLAPVAYDPRAEAPTFLLFLARIMEGNEEMLSFLKRALGYSLTGITSERVLFIGQGVGKNGKSTLVNAVMGIMGDYAQQTPTETLLTKREGSIPNDVARLKGARFVAAIEADEGKRLADATIKQLTGNDTVSARFLHQEFFDFRPTCKIWLMTNHKPLIRGGQAIWDRIRLIPFEVRIPPEEVNQDMDALLAAEYPGILAWMVAGTQEWREHGLGAPERVREATAEYREASDPLAGFFDDWCEFERLATTPKGKLRDAYHYWCRTSGGGEPLNKVQFIEKLKEKGLVEDRAGHSGERVWLGVRLRREVSEVSVLDPFGR